MDKNLAGTAIVEGMAASAVAMLRQQLRPVSFQAREVVFAEGEPGDRLYIVESGTVKISRRFDGHDYLQAILGPSDMFGELSLYDPGPRSSTATAVTKLRAVWMDRDGLRTVIAARPEIAGQLLRVLGRRLRRTNDIVADQVFNDVPGRVAKQLLLLAERFGTGDGDALRVIGDLTQDEIAQLAGASREATHKALHDFADRGWIRLQTSGVVILDSRRLARQTHYNPASVAAADDW